MEELNELENSKNLSAIKIRKAYMDFLSKEVKGIDEKLKDESLSEEERKKLTQTKESLSEVVKSIYSLETPTDEDIQKIKENLKELLAKKYDDKKLRSEIETLEGEITSLEETQKSHEEEIKKLEEEAKKAQDLHEFQEYLKLHFKALDYNKALKEGKIEFEQETQVKNMIANLADKYPDICGLDKMPKDTSNLNILKNQSLAINLEIENLRKDHKDTKELENLSTAVVNFVDYVDNLRAKAIKEEELDFEHNKEYALIEYANTAREIGTVDELNNKVAEIQKEIEVLEENLKNSDAMLVVNQDEETKKENEKDRAKLAAKKAELGVYLNEIKFRNLPDDLRKNNAIFALDMEEKRKKLDSLPADERIKREKELDHLEELHKHFYERDFAKEYQEIIDKTTKLKSEQEEMAKKIKENEMSIEPLRKDIDYITDSKTAIAEYETAKEKLDIVHGLDKIKEKAIKNFQGKEFTPEELKAFIESQEEFNLIKDAPDKEEIENLLMTEITNACKKQKVSNVRKDWKTYAKSAGFLAAGLATGLVLSSVPGVGTIRMGLATAKLAINAIDKGISLYNEKHQDKEPIRTISQVIDEELIAKLPKKIQSGLKKIEEKLKQKEVNLFLNGVSAGYIAGNVVEMVTGKTVFQNVTDKLNTPKTNIAESKAPSLASSNTPSTPSTETIKVPEVDIPTDAVTSLNVGEVYDLSSIPQGYVYSGSNDAVNLLTKAGKAVTLDKKVTVNGKVWCSFLQPDGKGYAWIPEDVVKSLGKVAEVEKGISR